MVVYAQLILENAKIYGVDDDLVGQIFDFMIRDTAQHALAFSLQASSTEKQMAQCRNMMRKPIADPDRYGRVWESVRKLDGAYEMKP
jgi:acyl-CoA dehydrogenase